MEQSNFLIHLFVLGLSFTHFSRANGDDLVNVCTLAYLITTELVENDLKLKQSSKFKEKLEFPRNSMINE